MFIVSSFNCFYLIHWRQALSGAWRFTWCNADSGIKLIKRKITARFHFREIHLMYIILSCCQCNLGGKPLSEPMMVSLPTPICVTRPQWVKQRMATKCIVYYTNVWSTEIAVIDFPAGSSTILVRCVCHQTWYTCLSTELGAPPPPLIYTINHISFLLTILHTISSNISYHPGYYAKTLRLWIYELHIKNDW